MNQEAEPLGPLRVRVPTGLLADWLARMPGLPLPAPFGGLAAVGSAQGDLPPPFVASSVATHGVAEVTAELHLSDGCEQSRSACPSRATWARRWCGEQARSPMWRRSGWSPAELAGEELLQWLPDAPAAADARAGIAVGTAAGERVHCWVQQLQAAEQGWCRLVAGRPAAVEWDELLADLQFLLLECRVHVERAFEA